MSNPIGFLRIAHFESMVYNRKKKNINQIKQTNNPTILIWTGMYILSLSSQLLSTYQGQFLNLDLDHNGMLSRTELSKFNNSTLTDIYLDRVFQGSPLTRFSSLSHSLLAPHNNSWCFFFNWPLTPIARIPDIQRGAWLQRLPRLCPIHRKFKYCRSYRVWVQVAGCWQEGIPRWFYSAIAF